MPLPLEGIRVLDITVVWAGPYSTMMMSDLGAEVIRVENTHVWQSYTRGFSARPKKEVVQKMGPQGGAYPDRDPGERPWNRYASFAAHGRNKLSMTCDLRQPEGKEIFKRLVAISDVLVENNAAGVLDRLGLGWDVLHAVNPRFIMLSSSGQGAYGPMTRFHGFGSHIEDLLGHSYLRGYADSDPSTLTGSVLSDAVAGAGIVAAVALALHWRNRTGEGQFIDMSQTENLIPYFGDVFMDYQMNGVIQGTTGNRDLSRAPQGCYPCRIPDSWIAISVADNQEWQALCAVLGRPDLARDEGLATEAGRRARHDELDGAIAAWTAHQDSVAAFHLLQRVGVTAGAVLDEAQLLADPQLRSRDFFRTIPHPEVGTYEYAGPLWQLSRTPLRIGRHAPLLGQDNEYVYKELLKISNGEYARLEREGHIGMDFDASIV